MLNAEVSQRKDRIHAHYFHWHAAIILASGLICEGDASNSHQLLRKSRKETRDSGKEAKILFLSSQDIQCRGSCQFGGNSIRV